MFKHPYKYLEKSGVWFENPNIKHCPNRPPQDPPLVEELTFAYGFATAIQLSS